MTSPERPATGAEWSAWEEGRDALAGLEQQLRFERLRTRLATSFSALPADAANGGAEEALPHIREFFGADEATLIRLSEDGGRLEAAHARCDKAPPSAFDPGERAGWYQDLLRQGETIRVDRAEESVRRGEQEAAGFRAHLCIPFTANGIVIGGLALTRLGDEQPWPDHVMGQVRSIAELFAGLLSRARAELARRSAEAAQGRREARPAAEIPLVIGQSDAIRRVLSQVEQVAATDSTVMILGETGTGKELIAHAIHARSARASRIMVKVNCAALPAALVEGELFGREKGAYTGALSKQIGRFELADESTIFLDEIGDLPLELQGKLLRVLQEGEFERLGSPRTVKVNARVIVATNRDLARAVQEGTFRADLYYRLNVFCIPAPALREHPEDIPLLTWAFVRQFTESMAKSIDTIPRQAMEALQKYHWPGNVRQLKNVIEHAMIISSGSTLRVEIPQADGGLEPPLLRMEDVERAHILKVLEMTRWRVSGRGGAAELLGLKPTTLESRMKRLGIERAG